mmetsp:Transcript_40271/g.88053  ORF Transcript_40271/g.88053 Transcript_40271/m.88053 type:complete len:236 (-) Transcript_40271:1259-1966(-)
MLAWSRSPGNSSPDTLCCSVSNATLWEDQSCLREVSICSRISATVLCRSGPTSWLPQSSAADSEPNAMDDLDETTSPRACKEQLAPALCDSAPGTVPKESVNEPHEPSIEALALLALVLRFASAAANAPACKALSKEALMLSILVVSSLTRRSVLPGWRSNGDTATGTPTEPFSENALDSVWLHLLLWLTALGSKKSSALLIDRCMCFRVFCILLCCFWTVFKWVKISFTCFSMR